MVQVREVTGFAPAGVHEVWIRGYSEAKLLDADPEFHRYYWYITEFIMRTKH
jgi:hypothetical protein